MIALLRRLLDEGGGLVTREQVQRAGKVWLLLASVGILVVRYAHRRLVHEPDEVRREILTILANRRAMLTWSPTPAGFTDVVLDR